MRIALPAVLLLALTVYALVDCLLTRRGAVPRRWAWVLLILLLPLIGPMAWLLLGRPRRQPPKPPPGRDQPLAPDDDPDFLRRLRPPDDADRA